MRDIDAAVSGHTAAAPERVLALVNDVEAYPSWYAEGVKRAEVRERDSEGNATKVFTVLALREGPIQRDFDMEMSVNRGEGWIKLSRLPKSLDDEEQFAVKFSVSPGTELGVSFNARLSIPAWLPLGNLPQLIPRGFLDAALAKLAE
ncbi:MAG: hypothetical protein J2O48_03725 [Solirubrobacterales bacterium]|nr:hypothetical protein [Solirubrobacterales bacterium]